MRADSYSLSSRSQRERVIGDGVPVVPAPVSPHVGASIIAASSLVVSPEHFVVAPAQ